MIYFIYILLIIFKYDDISQYLQINYCTITQEEIFSSFWPEVSQFLLLSSQILTKTTNQKLYSNVTQCTTRVVRRHGFEHTFWSRISADGTLPMIVGLKKF